MRVRLQSDTVALRVTSAPTTRADLPFGRLGHWFTRAPQILLLEDIGTRAAIELCFEMELVTEQLTRADLDTIVPKLPAEQVPLLAPIDPIPATKRKRRGS